MQFRTSHIGDSYIILLFPSIVKISSIRSSFRSRISCSGIGLGLSLSYDIISEEYKGLAKVETVEGEFCEFVIVLPKT